LVIVAAPAVLNTVLLKNAAAPLAGVLKFPAAPAVSVQFPETVGDALASDTRNVIARFPVSVGAESVTVGVVLVPVFDAPLFWIALVAVPLTSAPTTSNSMIPPPVPFVLVTFATHATDVGLPPANATQIDSLCVVDSVLPPRASFVYDTPCPVTDVGSVGEAE
jgi:hypothetical protein